MIHAVQAGAMAVGAIPLKMQLIPLLGVLQMTLSGVTIYINAETEESYMDLAPGFDKDIAVRFSKEITTWGYEVMEEVGSIEEFPDGTIRNYLAQTWFPDEEREEMTAAS